MSAPARQPAQPANGATKTPVPATPTPDRTPSVEPPRTCPLCGSALLGRHCKLVCPNCGYCEDCSDIFPA